MNNVVVFGANGFIGKNLVAELAKDQSNHIRAFDRFSTIKQDQETYFDQFDNVTLLRGDFLNRSDVESALAGIDYVFHLVSTTTPASTILDPYIDIDTNLRSSIQLFEACTKASVKKVIFLSSGGTVYGDIDSVTISENSVTKPKSPYGITKLAIENYLRYFNSIHGLDYIVYRIANPYGPHQNLYSAQGVIPIFIQKLLKSEELTIYGDGGMLRDYIYIDDVCRMINLSYRSKNKHAEYNIGSGSGKSVNEIVNQIESITGLKSKTVHKDTPATFVKTSVLDTERFINDFGEIEITSLNKGLESTIDYVKTAISE